MSCNLALVSWCYDLISSMVESGTSFPSACHNAALSTELLLRSIKMKNILAWCSHDFSTNCWTTKIMSEHPCFFQNLHCDSGKTFSASCCSRSCKMCATTLPTTSSRVIPRQLSQQLRSPFLGTGTNTCRVSPFLGNLIPSPCRVN